MNIGVIADFNAANLAHLLEKHSAELDGQVTLAPFGQVVQTVLQPASEFWNRWYDVVVLWTSPGAVIPSFNGLVGFGGWSAENLDRDVDAFTDLLRNVESRARTVLVASWVEPPVFAQRRSIEMKFGVGATSALLRMNSRLADAVAANSNIVLLNTERWLRQAGPSAFSDKLWYLSKTPYSNGVFEEAARDVVATIRGLTGLRKKVVILDLDNTLWGGVVGDVGWESIQLGGHDPVGEAYVQFQRELKRLSFEGIVLAVVSKNEETIALEAIERNPEMILRSRDFAGWRINWADKAQNIADLMADLNLGVDSAVFIDDSPHERSRVRQALPDVLVPEWPSDPLDFTGALRELRCFESPAVTQEDRTRTAMYVADRERKELRAQLHSVDQWLQTLDLEVSIERLSESNVERAAQLLNKTNQMNLTTRRMSMQEFSTWAAEGNHQVWTFRVKDKLGDYGLCGVASLAYEDSRADVIDFVLSCRAMGRGIEETMISAIAKKGREAGVDRLTASYIATKKNKPCLQWMEHQTIFSRQGDGTTFSLDTTRDIAAPEHIRITWS